jgi:hypothetical protein
MHKKIICFLSFIAIFLFILPGYLYCLDSVLQIDTERLKPDSIYVEEEIIDAEVFIRVPESSVQPRTRTEELDFTLNYLRRVLIESNKELY